MDQTKTKFKLDSGMSKIRPNVLPKKIIKRLENIANEYMKDTNSRPVYIGRQAQLGKETRERYINSGLKYIIQASRPWIEKNIGKNFLIINSKSLIRRTWPMSETNSRQLGHNASNLTWHQDSNIKHKESPMLVLMVMMQDECGSVRPGLSIMEETTNNFESIYGYEGNKVEEFEDKVIEKYGRMRTYTPKLNAGDLLIFNGLTFHRTYSNEKMKKSRDALLIRIIKPKDASNFPNENNVIINLGESKEHDYD